MKSEPRRAARILEQGSNHAIPSFLKVMLDLEGEKRHFVIFSE
ncbi:hypothetical protein SBDP1_1450014 [Syntrophobacter sp. SbD1]|nr:hypothetical protein SBDP1_1450014 [Syntrophobacter sp. SbD1]